MADIFMSYASEDRARAKELADALSRRGWEVWWDRKIPVGRSFHQSIEQAIEDARCVIVLWSRNSVDSDWVRNEAEEGQRRRILAPVLLDGARPPLGFRHLQAADLSDWVADRPHAAFDSLLETVQTTAGASAKAATQLEPPQAAPDHGVFGTAATLVPPSAAAGTTGPPIQQQPSARSELPPSASGQTATTDRSPTNVIRPHVFRVFAALGVAAVAIMVIWLAVKPSYRVPPASSGSPSVETVPATDTASPTASNSGSPSELRVAWQDGPLIIIGRIATDENTSPRPFEGSVYDGKTGALVVTFKVPAVVKGFCPDKCEIIAKISLNPGRTDRMLIAELNFHRDGNTVIVETCPQTTACRHGVVVADARRDIDFDQLRGVIDKYNGSVDARHNIDPDQMRGVIDKYNKSAKDIIDSMR